jgi:hypothetical protein
MRKTSFVPKTRARSLFTLLISTVFIFISFYSTKGVAMSFFTGTEVVLFSPMEGKITFEGKPAANAKITRTIIWKGDAGETDTFYTNQNGEFKLPIKRAKVRIPLLMEFVLTQEVGVFYEGKDYSVWVKAKQDLGEYGELGGRPINLRCELTDKRVRLEDFNGLFGTSFKWDSIEYQGVK